MEQSATLLTPDATVDDITNAAMAKLEAPQVEVSDEPAAPAVTPQQEPVATEQEPELIPTYKVKVRGQEVEVNLDELRNGYSRTEDYKAKTAELADQRRAVEAEQAKISELKSKQLAAIENALALPQKLDPVLSEGLKTDWAALAQTDPTAYVQKRAIFDARVGEVRELLQEQERLKSEQQTAQQQRITAFVSEQSRMLAEKLPEWANDEGRAKVNTTVSNYLQTAGFSNDEIKQLVDHRVLMVALEAAKYRELIAAQGNLPAKKTAPVAPKTSKPLASNDGRRADAQVVSLKKQAIRSGRDADIMAAAMAALKLE